MSLQTSVEVNTQGGPSEFRLNGWDEYGVLIPLPQAVCRLPWNVPGRADSQHYRLLFSASTVVLKKRPTVGEKDTNRKVVDFTRLIVSAASHLGTSPIVRIDHFGAASSV